MARIDQAAEALCEPGEHLAASAWARLVLGDDTWGLGWWFLALPLTWWRKRQRRASLSVALGVPLPEFGAVAVTNERVLFFRSDRLTLTRPRLVGSIDRKAVEGAERPTVGGYLRSLKLWIRPKDSERVELRLLVVGEPGEAVADALDAIRPAPSPARS